MQRAMAAQPDEHAASAGAAAEAVAAADVVNGHGGAAPADLEAPSPAPQQQDLLEELRKYHAQDFQAATAYRAE